LRDSLRSLTDRDGPVTLKVNTLYTLCPMIPGLEVNLKQVQERELIRFPILAILPTYPVYTVEILTNMR
jgi:hypothetical protein